MTQAGRCALAIIVMAAVTGAACVQEPDDVFPFPVSVFELENGLKVVSVALDSPGIVAYYTVVRTGSRNEVEEGSPGTRTSSST